MLIEGELCSPVFRSPREVVSASGGASVFLRESLYWSTSTCQSRAWSSSSDCHCHRKAMASWMKNEEEVAVAVKEFFTSAEVKVGSEARAKRAIISLYEPRSIGR